MTTRPGFVWHLSPAAEREFVVAALFDEDVPVSAGRTPMFVGLPTASPSHQTTSSAVASSTERSRTSVSAMLFAPSATSSAMRAVCPDRESKRTRILFMTSWLSGKGLTFQWRQARCGWIVTRDAFVSDSRFRMRLEKPPNVIVILADDLGWTGLACFGRSACG